MLDSFRWRHDNSMRVRIAWSRLKPWLLFEANRLLVAGSVLVVIFLALVGAGVADPGGLRAAMRSSDPIETLFQGLLTGIITGVTLVVSINQVVLSQELGPLGDQRERMAGAMAFREDVEALLGSPVSPIEPSSFLRALIELAGARAEQLAETVERDGDPEIRERVRDYTAGIVENAESVTDDLTEAQFGTFDVLSAALDFDYSWKLYEARRLRHEYGEALSEQSNAALEDLIEALEFFAPAREHFKTIYFQWELVDLSRTMLYAAVPALIVAVVGILYLDTPGTITGRSLGVDNLVWTVAAATVVALSPFAVLAAYVIRIATVAKRTLAIGPFVLQDGEGGGEE